MVKNAKIEAEAPRDREDDLSQCLGGKMSHPKGCRKVHTHVAGTSSSASRGTTCKT